METPPMFTAFFDAIKSKPFHEVVFPMPQHLQDKKLKYKKKWDQVIELMKGSSEEWMKSYAEMCGNASLPASQSATKSVTEEVPYYVEGDESVPLVTSHSHLFPCILSSLGSGCDFSKVRFFKK